MIRGNSHCIHKSCVDCVNLDPLMPPTESPSWNLITAQDVPFDLPSTYIGLGCRHKQQGRAAEEANNVFHHYTYEGSFDMEAITDPLQRQVTYLAFLQMVLHRHDAVSM